MRESPVAVVRELLERINSGDVESGLELLTPDVVFVVPPDASAEPDTYEGHEGARRYFNGFDGVLDEVRFEPIDLEQVSDDTVLADMSLAGRGAATGIPVAQRTFVLMTVRDGLVSWIMPYAERAAALEAVRSRAR